MECAALPRNAFLKSPVSNVQLNRPQTRSTLKVPLRIVCDANDSPYNAHKLDKLFRSRGSDEEWSKRGAKGGVAGVVIERKASKTRELPMLVSPWVLLPGWQDTLHVFQPHLVHMFESLLARPPPWRYVHVLALDDGATARPVVGVVAEIQEVERFPDGRLLLLTTATKKVRILQTSTFPPFQRAFVESAKDEEEVLVKALDPCTSIIEVVEEPGSPLGASAFVHKNGVRSSGPDWDPEVAAAAVMVYELRRRERLLWDCYDKVRALSGRLREGKPPPVHLSLVPLRPAGWTTAGFSASAAEAWEEPAGVVKRVQLLSYQMATVLPDLHRGQGRQQILAVNSVCERMDLIAGLLTGRLNELAARVAVKDALQGGSSSQGSGQ